MVYNPFYYMDLYFFFGLRVDLLYRKLINKEYLICSPTLLPKRTGERLKKLVILFRDKKDHKFLKGDKRTKANMRELSLFV